MADDRFSDVLSSLPLRISDVLRPWAERSPEGTALVGRSGTWTYRQLASVVDETEAWLRDSEVRPGDRVVIVGDNCRAFVALLFASAAVDAWPVLVSSRISPRELDTIREHCGARRVVYTTSVSPNAFEHAQRDGASIVEVPGLGSVGLGPLDVMVEPEPIDSNAPDRVGALIYTSGTTGLPKGVMLTHRNLLYVAAVSARIRSLAPQDRVFGVLTMSHAVGLSVVLLGSLLSGSTVHLFPRFDPVSAIAALQNDQITIFLGVPSMFALLMEYAKSKGFPSRKFPALCIISSSGAPLEATLKAQVESFFGLVLHNGYGVTELSPNIAQTRIDSPRSDTSVGPPLPGLEIKLIGSDGHPVADAEIGELWVRGPNVMKGYYHAPEETAAVLDQEGWFNTRDLARLQDGNLFIVGRATELIVRFGFNVHPAEVEAVLNSHPDVARSAVIGRPVASAQGGEEIVAFVQCPPGSLLSASELIRYAAHDLAPYKVPSKILFVPSMPVTPTGKIAKTELSKMIAVDSATR